MQQINDRLEVLFSRRRIVFWYDPEQELTDVYEALSLEAVEKVRVDRNLLSIKKRLLRDQPSQKFLLYFSYAQPEDVDNWLLDVQLANETLISDTNELYANEVGLPQNLWHLGKDHRAFFQSQERRQKLKGLLQSNDSKRTVKLKMIAVLLKLSNTRLESVLNELLIELSLGDEESYQLLVKHNLVSELWAAVEKAFHYLSDTPHIFDFTLKLFEAGFLQSIGQNPGMNREAITYLNSLKENLRTQEAFIALSDQFEDTLDVPKRLSKIQINDLLKSDIFKTTDHMILESLLNRIQSNSISPEEFHGIAQSRERTFWFKRFFEHYYGALEKANKVLISVRNENFEINTFDQGLRSFTQTWHEIDRDYREFVWHTRQLENDPFFEELKQTVEKIYVNNFLFTLNNHWQIELDKLNKWESQILPSQASFYHRYVEKSLMAKAKVAVIVSDALRFEIAQPLSQAIESNTLSEARIQPMLTCLPSYTALGMAAILPHKQIELSADGQVLLDGLPTAGIANRDKILKNANADQATAMGYQEFQNLNKEQRRGVFRDNKVIYIYHNQIDMVGDKLESEDRTVDAVETTIQEITSLVKQLRSANFTRILITADHGFLYQHQALDEADMLGEEAEADRIVQKNRRFVIGEGFRNLNHLKWFNGDQLGLETALEFAIVKSNNRLRVKGAGKQFVHGGASLQEVVIPVIDVSIIRDKEEVKPKPVSFDRILPGTTMITTGQLTVKFIQTAPVDSKHLERTIFVSLVASDDTLLSDVKTVLLNSKEENERVREQQVVLYLNSISQNYNQQEVYLIAKELIPNTDKQREVGRWPYLMNKALFATF